MSNSSVWYIDRALSGVTTPGQSDPRGNGNERVLRITQRFSVAGASPSDCFVSYPGHSLGGGSYPPAEMQSVYSTAPADWAFSISTGLGYLLQILNEAVCILYCADTQGEAMNPSILPQALDK